MNSQSQPFLPPQDPDQIRELAHLYATEGLGAHEDAFHQWLDQASDEDQIIFASEVDAVSTLTMAMLTDDTPPPLDLNAIVNPPKKEFPAGFFYQGSTEGEYRELPVKGARVKELSNSPADGFTVMMLEMDPGCHFPGHNHKGSEQVYLLDGDLSSDGVELSPGDFLRAAADTHHGGLSSELGCHALIITAQQNYPAKAIHLYDRLAKSVRKVKRKILG
ncbi:cupin domain-containing protein [Verrucomicrobiaceae bacterium 227]